jgi:dihydrofolate reductase
MGPTDGPDGRHVGKVLYSATMSLDGYIAGPGGDMSWLTPYLGPNPEIDDLQRRIGALLIGARTFSGDDPNRGTDKEGAFSGTWTGPSFVVTHHPPAVSVDRTEFFSDVETGLAAATAAAGDAYVNILGADIARQCLELGQLDEVLAIIAPVMLGDGTPLFHHPGGRSVRLERISATTGPLATNVWMRVVR